MDDEDPETQEVLELSYEILNLIESNIDCFTEEEKETLYTSNESIQFFLDIGDEERSLIEAKQLKEYLLKITT